MLKKVIIPIGVTLIFTGIMFYLTIPAINLRSSGFWTLLIACFFCYIITRLLCSGFNFDKFKISDIFDEKGNKIKTAGISKKIKYIFLAVILFVILLWVVYNITSTRLFRAKSYRQLLDVTVSDFNEDISEIPFTQIPVVDRDTALRLGARKIGEVVELVSQFNVSDYYTQINFNNTPTRVSPLEYADFLKWMFNRKEGIPYYVSIDMATQETKLVELVNGMKYSPGEYFNRDLLRHVRFSYPTKMINEVSFEIDDDGKPYWIVSTYDYTIGILGGRDVNGIIIVDAVNGEMSRYDTGDIPEWVDRVYSADLIVSQANDWGQYEKGYWNSIIGQKGVIQTTDGYNYLAVDNDVWLYTGLTSVVADESNVGFILINLRTKEARNYQINGAEEYSATSSAEGRVQEKRYIATFPILINLGDKPTYFMSLKDNAGLIKSYAFVSVENYQIVGVGETILQAQNEYFSLFDDSPEPAVPNSTETSGKIEKITMAVNAGYTHYYIKLENDSKIYIASIQISDLLPILVEGDSIKIKHSIDEIEFLKVFEIEKTD